MKLVALTLLGVVGLSGCGTLSPSATSASTAPAVDAATAVPSQAGIDHARMTLIDEIARRRGVQVVWINRPRLNVAPGS